MGNAYFRVLSRGKLTVLLFHKVPLVRSPFSTHEIELATFEKVLGAVSRLFQVIPLEDAVLALRAGNLPPRAACITFDDGYADWLTGVIPVLESHKAHATFFITSGQFSGLPMWNERILNAVANAPAAMEWLELPESGLRPLSLLSLDDRRQAINFLDQHLKYQEPVTRERLIAEMERLAGVDRSGVPTMSVDDLRAIHAKGFGIGSHTVTHPILARCDAAMAFREMVEAREQLEELVRGKVTAFAYPNGVPETDFRAEHIEMVKRAGYACAVTTHWGAATNETSVFQIPRFTPWGPSAFKMDFQFARNLLQQPRTLPEVKSEHKKKVLMVAFHFPPQAGSSGILRTLNFVKYLPRSGWEPVVLTANPRAYTEQRNDLVAAIPPGTRVLRAFALDAAQHLSVVGKYPRILAVPDRWASWWLGAVFRGLREIRRQRPELIWSTYPISTAHLIGASLSRLSGLPWVADFRDPMVSANYPEDRLQRWVWKFIESYVMRHAKACVFTTERAASAYAQRYPIAADKCVVIENGFDEDAFVGVQSNRHGTPESHLLMLHSGLIYPQDRNPSAFFAAVVELIREGAIDRSRLCIRFRAPHHEVEVRQFAALHGLEDVVDIAPPIPYRAAIAEMMGADLLIVIQGSNFNAQIPAKIYEYLRAQKPILALVDPVGDTATQLKKFQEVLFGDIADKDSIKTTLSNFLQSTSLEMKQKAFLSNLVAVGRYSRIAQTERLGSLLNEKTG